MYNYIELNCTLVTMSEIINSEPTAVGPGGDVQFSWPWPLYTTAWTPVTNGTPAVYVTTIC